jgi:hypothetical protein
MATVRLKLGTLVDRLYKAQQAVAEANREKSRAEQEVQRRKAAAKKVENELLDRFKKGELEGAAGKIAKCALKQVVGPQLKDWGKLAAYVIKNKAPELFQRRISKEAWLEHLDQRKQRPVPGISVYKETRLSVTKKG